MFLCQLSGIVPIEPVITPGGILFEKRLIEEHLEKVPRCPISDDPLKKSDLVPLKVPSINAPSNAAAAGDIPGLTAALQKQFDTLLMENQQLRKERDEARHQVTHLMYLRDGATRVVSKHLQEIDLLKQKLAAAEREEPLRKHARLLQGSSTLDNFSSPEEFPRVVNAIGELAKDLLAARKNRKIIARPPAAFSSYQSASPSHKILDYGSPPLCMDVLCSGVWDPAAPSKRKIPALSAFGHEDGTISVCSWLSEKPSALLKGHEGAVTSVKSLFYPSVSHLSSYALGALNSSSETSAPFKSCFNLLSGSSDGSVRLWTENSSTKMEELDYLCECSTPAGGVKFVKMEAPGTAAALATMDWSCQHIFRLNRGGIRQVELHPHGKYAGIVTSDPTSGWSFIDILTMQLLQSFPTPEPVGMTALAFQPDGNVIIAAAADNTLPVWDLRTKGVKAKPSVENITGSVSTITFSEIGYIVTIGTSCGKVQVWDLRKTNVIQEVDVCDAPIHQVLYDHSGSHIAIASDKGLSVYSQLEKKKVGLAHTYDIEGGVRAVKFDHRTDDYIYMLQGNGELHCRTAV